MINKNVYEGHGDQRYGHITYSHCGEDIVILNIFNLIGIDKPSYIDVGAHHPFSISNTALLYQLGSRGINIEANPNLILAFNEHRPEDINLNIGIGPEAGILPFYMFDPESGRNTFVKENAKPFDHVGLRFEVTEIKDIEVHTLNQVIEKHGRWPDLLCMDIEGLDAKVLCSTNFALGGPKVICVEALAWDNNTVLKGFLALHGYLCYCRLNVDLIFVKRDYIEKLY